VHSAAEHCLQHVLGEHMYVHLFPTYLTIYLSIYLYIYIPLYRYVYEYINVLTACDGPQTSTTRAMCWWTATGCIRPTPSTTGAVSPPRACSWGPRNGRYHPIACPADGAGHHQIVDHTFA
jgi:hypothetical protein